MIAVKDAAVTEGGQVPLDQRPEVVALAAETDQRRQLQIAAALSRRMLERISPVYAVLRDAAATDDILSEHLAAEIDRRRAFQRALIERVGARGPLRKRLTTAQAAETYSALANPDLYLLLTTHHHWSADDYQAWLADSLERLLLPKPIDPARSRPRTIRTSADRSEAPQPDRATLPLRPPDASQQPRSNTLPQSRSKSYALQCITACMRCVRLNCALS